MYAQIALGNSVSEAGLYLMTFFAGFAVASQFGGRMLDNIGAKAPVVLGCVVAAGRLRAVGQRSSPTSTSTTSGTSSCVAGAGIGPDARARRTPTRSTARRAVNYGEVSGVTQTVRNYGASLGMAVLGTILISQNVSNVEDVARRARRAGRRRPTRSRTA